MQCLREFENALHDRGVHRSGHDPTSRQNERSTLADFILELRMLELASREVDTHDYRRIVRVLRMPDADLPASLLQYPLTDRHDQPRVFGCGYETRGRNESMPRSFPPYECFDFRRYGRPKANRWVGSGAEVGRPRPRCGGRFPSRAAQASRSRTCPVQGPRSGSAERASNPLIQPRWLCGGSRTTLLNVWA
jgi:hypothetical protein